MPDLAEIADSDDLEDRYLDRPIVYVEGDSDAAVFTAIMGAELTARVTFKAPFQGGSGCMAVINRVRQERPHNKKIFGLVDGETAAVLGGIEAFLACEDHFFEMPDDAETEGVLFLSSHELENVLILHGGFCEHVRDDVNLPSFGTLTADRVRDIVRQVTQRFFLAALLKYGVTLGRRAGEATPDFEIGWFLDPNVSATSIVRRMRAQLTAAGGNWAAFSAQLAALIARLKGHFRDASLDLDARRDDLVRLADGKGLLKGVKAAVDNRYARWEGHLARALIARPYGDAFRERLLAFTAR